MWIFLLDFLVSGEQCGRGGPFLVGFLNSWGMRSKRRDECVGENWNAVVKRLEFFFVAGCFFLLNCNVHFVGVGCNGYILRNFAV